MDTNALHSRKRSAQGAKAKAGWAPGEPLQHGGGRFRQQPEGNEWHGAPLFVALLAKTEYCIDKHKLLIVRPYQAALRESGRKKEMVAGLRKLYDAWLDSLIKLVPGAEETDEAYKQRVLRPYAEFNEQIQAIRTLSTAPAAPAAKAARPVKKK